MNAHRLYSAIQATERALHHLRRAWMEQDGVVARSQTREGTRREVEHAGLFLGVAVTAAKEAAATETPEEPATPPAQ